MDKKTILVGNIYDVIRAVKIERESKKGRTVRPIAEGEEKDWSYFTASLTEFWELYTGVCKAYTDAVTRYERNAYKVDGKTELVIQTTDVCATCVEEYRKLFKRMNRLIESLDSHIMSDKLDLSDTTSLIQACNDVSDYIANVTDEEMVSALRKDSRAYSKGDGPGVKAKERIAFGKAVSDVAIVYELNMGFAKRIQRFPEDWKRAAGIGEALPESGGKTLKASRKTRRQEKQALQAENNPENK